MFIETNNDTSGRYQPCLLTTLDVFNKKWEQFPTIFYVTKLDIFKGKSWQFPALRQGKEKKDFDQKSRHIQPTLLQQNRMFLTSRRNNLQPSPSWQSWEDFHENAVTTEPDNLNQNMIIYEPSPSSLYAYEPNQSKNVYSAAVLKDLLPKLEWIKL